MGRQTRDIMGMPVSVEVVGGDQAIHEDVFSYFTAVDQRFSPYKADSEVSRMNTKRLAPAQASAEMQTVLALAEATTRETGGFFDVYTPDGALEPSGIVKGWAIWKAAQLLRAKGYEHFWVEAGGDIQTSGLDAQGRPWSIGIRNPFKLDEIVKVVYPAGAGIATSGTYLRGQHIYDPHDHKKVETDLVSLTVIGPNVYEADRFATAAFAMGESGILFLEQHPALEGYAIDTRGQATMTSGFAYYTEAPAPVAVPALV